MGAESESLALHATLAGYLMGWSTSFLTACRPALPTDIKKGKEGDSGELQPYFIE